MLLHVLQDLRHGSVDGGVLPGVEGQQRGQAGVETGVGAVEVADGQIGHIGARLIACVCHSILRFNLTSGIMVGHS